jgi:ADP-ribose pyrophosphatase YjhB (NUDIX family)
MLSHVELSGNEKTPYHFSVGAVIRRKDTFAIIKKDDTSYTLLRETAHANETIVDCLNRGAREELGMTINPIRFLGGLLTHFKRGSDTDIEKTTIYFEVEIKDVLATKNQESDETNDTVLWVTYEEAARLLKEQNNPELQILERIKNV